jgi:hypothetical protein
MTRQTTQIVFVGPLITSQYKQNLKRRSREYISSNNENEYMYERFEGHGNFQNIGSKSELQE